MSVRTAIFATLLILPVANNAAAADSVYTVLDFDHGGCKQVGGPQTQEDIDLGSLSLLCKGYKGYPVAYDQGDERTTVHFGDPDRVTTRSGWESFESFNSTADKIEWRVDERKIPRAAIYRATLSMVNPDPAKADETIRGQILVVSTVGQPGGPAGCVIGLVDALANADANVIAREIADRTAATFKCGKDIAVYHGKRGDRSSDFTASFSE